jgi:hypothetical protein
MGQAAAFRRLHWRAADDQTERQRYREDVSLH